jgi:hypothetical protein
VDHTPLVFITRGVAGTEQRGIFVCAQRVMLAAAGLLLGGGFGGLCEKTPESFVGILVRRRRRCQIGNHFFRINGTTGYGISFNDGTMRLSNK